MVQTSYSNDTLYKLAKKNYNKLIGFCRILEEDGYWEEPKEILKKPILEILDMYVQAVLINLAVYCGKFQKEQKWFIISIPENNAIGCTQEEVKEDVLFAAKRLVESPPILMQLCGVRDLEKHTFLTGEFFDCFLNILLAMASLNNERDGFAGKFIQEYYEKIRVFLYRENVDIGINHRYLFKKLSSDQIGENFLFQPEEIKTDIFSKEESKEEKFIVLQEELEEDQIKQIRNELEKNIEVNSIKAVLEELNQLIGLKEVKEEINSLVNLIKVKKLRELHNMPVMDMSYHMVFTGNPGTGKTTVARLIARIYKELGILSKGHLVEVDRSGLVAGYVGQTALKSKEIIEKAIGGILFIDEAYSLTNHSGSNDFGSEVIDTLVKMMEDHRDDLVVIVAGYRDEMGEFLKSNTGLISRFNKFIDFPDYNVEELIRILDTMVGTSGMMIEESGKERMKKEIETMSDENKKIYGNGRGIRNTFEKIMVNQANRLVQCNETSVNALSMILEVDVTGTVI